MPITKDNIEEMISDYCSGMKKIDLCTKYSLTEYGYRKICLKLKERGIEKKKKVDDVFENHLDAFLKTEKAEQYVARKKEEIQNEDQSSSSENKKQKKKVKKEKKRSSKRMTKLQKQAYRRGALKLDSEFIKFQ